VTSTLDPLFFNWTGSLYTIPSKINNPSLVVKDVACGNEHTVFLTATGLIYTFGQGRYELNYLILWLKKRIGKSADNCFTFPICVQPRATWSR